MTMLSPSFRTCIVFRLAGMCFDLSLAVIITTLVGPDVFGNPMFRNMLFFELSAGSAELEE